MLLHVNGFDIISGVENLISQGWTTVPPGGFAISSTRTKAPADGPSGTIKGSLRIYAGTSATNHTAYLPTNSTADTLICQFYVFVDDDQSFYNGSPLLSFRQGSTVQMSVSLGTYSSDAGRVNVRNAAGTSLGQSVTQISQDTWYYISVKIKFHATAGTIEVKINNVTEIYLSNINTAPSGSAYASDIRIMGQATYGTGYAYVDNFILCDNTGEENNDFYNGVVWVLTKPAASDTSVADWSILSGLTGYQMVDDTTPDGDTTYIYSPDNTVGDESRFLFGSFSGVPNARYVGVRVLASSRVDAGTVGTKITAEYDGHVAESAESLNSTSFLVRALQLETAPDGTTPLSDVVVNNLAGGIKVSSAS